MKKIVEPKDAYLKPVKLYLNDLEEILGILKIEHSSSIEIKYKGYEYESFTELREKNGIHIKELEIRQRNPYISIKINKNQKVRIYTNGENNEEISNWNNIKELLSKNIKKTIPSLNLWFISFPLFIIVGFLDMFIEKNYNQYRPYSLVLMIILSLELTISATKALIVSDLYLDYKHNIPTFWTSKKHDIWVGIICGIVGTILGIILTKLLL